MTLNLGLLGAVLAREMTTDLALSQRDVFDAQAAALGEAAIAQGQPLSAGQKTLLTGAVAVQLQELNSSHRSGDDPANLRALLTALRAWPELHEVEIPGQQPERPALANDL
jgi:hypothetical protein